MMNTERKRFGATDVASHPKLNFKIKLKTPNCAVDAGGMTAVVMRALNEPC